MKWIKLLIDIALIIIPGLGLKFKKDVDQELVVAKQTIRILTKDMSPEEKGRAIEDAVHGLKFVKDFKARSIKKLNKAKDRLYKKLF